MRTRVLLRLEIDHEGGAPIQDLIEQLEGETIRDRETRLPRGVIDSAEMVDAEVIGP